MKKRLAAILTVCFFLAAGLSLWPGNPAGAVPPPQKQVTVLFVGDTAFGENYQEAIAGRGGISILQSRGYDYGFEKLKPLIQRADVVVTNLETPLTDLPASPLSGRKTYLHWSDVRKAPPVLQKNRMRLLSLANNHTLDYGLQGLTQTLNVLRQNGLHAFGAGANEPDAARPAVLDFSINGRPLRVLIAAGFEYRSSYETAYAFYARKTTGGVNEWSVPKATAQIQALRKANPDAFIIAFPHWGKNYQWKTAGQTALGHALIDAGADMVMGHGAHQLQEIEPYRGRWIIYSLGNFMFNSPGRYEKESGFPFSLAALLTITEKNGGLDFGLRLYPILSDNRITGYQTRPVTAKEFESIHKNIITHSIDPGFLQTTLTRGRDEAGLFFTFGAATARHDTIHHASD